MAYQDDLDEEIRRQAAISALLAQQPDAQPEPDQPPKDTQPPADVKDVYGDWKKWPSISPEQAADIPTIDQPPAPAGHVDLAPPGHIDLTPPQQASTVPVPTPPTDIQTDPETGTRYVTDEGTGTKVPYAEPATAADKEAFKPGDVTLPQVTTEGTAEVQPAPDKLDQVERATLVKFPKGVSATQPWHPAGQKPVPGFIEGSDNAILNPAAGVIQPSRALTNYNRNQQWTDPDPDNPNFKTPLSPQDELAFQAWVKKNKVPFDDSAQSDYDMRGFWKAAQEGDPDASTAVSKFDGRIHFNDKFKTPFHKTFSNESQYATNDAPHWDGDRLIDKDGNVVADETPPAKPGKPGAPTQPTDEISKAEDLIWQQVRDGKISREEAITQVQQIIDDASTGYYVPVTPYTGHEVDLTSPDQLGATKVPVKPAPGKLTQVEKALPVFPTGPRAPGAHTELAPPGQMDLRPDEVPPTPAPASTPTASASTATQPAQPAVKPVADDWKTWTTIDGTPAEPQAAKPATVETAASTEPMLNAPNGKAPVALIIHHTSGRGNAASVVDGWRTERPGVGAQMIIDRDGTLHYTQKEFGYGGTGNFLHSVVPGVSNQTAVGVEVVAKDDNDMTPAQLDTLKKMAGPGGAYANVPVYGHSQVSPGDRDNEGVRGVNAIMEARKSGDSGQVLQQLKDTGLNVTHYAYIGDPNLDADSAAGSGKYVEKMVPGFDVAMNAAAAKLVGNPQPGQTFQYAGRTWRYGDKVPEKYSDARFDVYDPNNTALTGGQLGGTQQAAAQPKKEDWESWSTLPPESEAAVTKAQQDQLKILDAVNQNTPNKGALWKILNSGVPGVSSGTMQAYKDQFKKQVTQYALDYYKPGNPNITPEDAFKMATGDADFGTLAGEVATKVVPNLTKAAIAMERSQDTIDENRINQFLNAINPNMPPEQRVEFKRSMMAMTPAERSQHINEGLAQMDPGAVAAFNPTDIADSFDRISDPVYQAKRKQALDAAVAKNQKDLQTDPKLVNTPAEGVTQFLASAPKNVSEMLTPVIGQSAMLSEIYTDTSDQLRKEHPDWSDDDVKQKATASTVAQLGPQVLISAVTGGALSAATKGITQPLLELGARLGLHGTVAGVAGGIQQMLKNNVEGNPKGLMDGVQEAVIANSAFGVLGGALAGAPEVKPIGSPLETGKVHGPEAQVDVGFPHGPGEPEAQPPGVQRPVTVEQNVPEAAPSASRPWYMEGAEPGQDPLVIRGAERTTFTPQELAEAVQRTSASSSPEELRQRFESLQSPAAWFLDSAEAQQAEIDKAQAAQAPSPPPKTLEEAITQQRRAAAAASLGETTKATEAARTEAAQTTATARVSESDPYTSRIANRYTAERMATGELGQIDPSEGKSTEEMVMHGLKMSPDQRERLINNFNRGVGGDLDNQGAAIRSKEALLSIQSRDASRSAAADSANAQLQAQAKAAHDAVTAFHNGPIKKFKRVWSDAGRGLQREIPLDYTTFNGMKEAYLKGRGNGTEAPPEFAPKLKQMADTVTKVTNKEYAATTNYNKEIGDYLEKQTRGKPPLPSDDQVRTRLMEIMNDLPCRT